MNLLKSRKRKKQEFHERVALLMMYLKPRERQYLAETLLLLKLPKETREMLEVWTHERGH